MNSQRTLPWINFSATLVTLVVNALANLVPLNGQTTGDVTTRISSYFVPAGYVFSIWGLIYLGLLAFSVYQLLNPQRCATTLKHIGYLYLVSSAANCAWLFFWHFNLYGLALLAILVLLGSLIGIYLRLGVNLRAVTFAEVFHTRLVFSLYLGWIAIATVANASVALVATGWDGWGLPPEAWTVILIIVTVALATIVTLTRHDIAYLLVQAWGLSGIAVAQRQIPLIATSAWIATAIIGLLVIIALVLQRAYIVRPFSLED